MTADNQEQLQEVSLEKVTLAHGRENHDAIVTARGDTLRMLDQTGD